MKTMTGLILTSAILPAFLFAGFLYHSTQITGQKISLNQWEDIELVQIHFLKRWYAMRGHPDEAKQLRPHRLDKSRGVDVSKQETGQEPQAVVKSPIKTIEDLDVGGEKR